MKTNPLLMDLNPPSRNPGSEPDFYTFYSKMAYYTLMTTHKICLKTSLLIIENNPIFTLLHSQINTIFFLLFFCSVIVVGNTS